MRDVDLTALKIKFTLQDPCILFRFFVGNVLNLYHETMYNKGKNYIAFSL